MLTFMVTILMSKLSQWFSIPWCSVNLQIISCLIQWARLSNFYPGLTMTNLQLCQKSLPISIECHTQYNVSKCLQMLSIVQLLHFEVRNTGMLARCDMLFQLMFSDLSGALVNSGTTTTCNLIDVILDVKSLQLIDLVWLIETIENLKHINVFYTTFHSNTIFMTFLNFQVDERVIYQGNTEESSYYKIISNNCSKVFNCTYGTAGTQTCNILWGLKAPSANSLF